MSAKALTKTQVDPSGSTGSSEQALPREAVSGADRCFHCGTRVPNRRYCQEGKAFCCVGCLTVFELFTENGLEQFYQLAPQAGPRLDGQAGSDQFGYLEAPDVRQRLVDFSDDALTRVTFQIPAAAS